MAGTVASCCVGQAAWHLLFQSRATLLRFGWRNHGKVFDMMDSTEYLPPSFARVAWLCFFDSLLKKLAATPSCCTRRRVWVLDRLLRMACNLLYGQEQSRRWLTAKASAIIVPNHEVFLICMGVHMSFAQPSLRASVSVVPKRSAGLSSAMQ